MNKNNIALVVEYLGNNYNGWQKNKDNISVQAKLENAISEVANQQINLICAGRTDSGVHATWQVVNFFTCVKRNNRQWLKGINANLPYDIKVKNVVEVNDNFTARFNANQRHYCYVINTKVSAIFAKMSLFIDWHLDIENMQKAANFLLGEHDFSAFRSSSCQANTSNRFVSKAKIARQADLIVFYISANAFLHHMVRNIVGTLLVVGKGDKSFRWVQEVLDSKDRKNAGPTAKAHGLFLIGVDYPDYLELTGKSGPCFLV